MTLRLGQWVQHGELWCQRRYSVGGCLRFGGDHPLMQLELTGQSQGILRGRRVVFRPLWNSVDYLHESNKEGGDDVCRHRTRLASGRSYGPS